MTDEPGDDRLHSGMIEPGTLILVVDDHPTNRMVMRSQINALGYASEDVESGSVAIERWQTGNFSLVLTDLNMPIMSGYDLSRRIREIEAGSSGTRIPIIACSANVIPGVVEECVAAGMDDYIAKPISLQVMREKLAKWLPVPVPTADRKEGISIGQRALAHFREVNDVDVMHLLDAVEHGDMGAVAHMAHRIKGACGFIGATGLASVCGMIEQAGREERSVALAGLIDALRIEQEQLYATLDG
ncbi:MAG: response regulator [Thermomonas sp.]